MKNINYDCFLSWIQKHFPDAKANDGTIKINSIFCDHLGGDQKFHLWCKPSFNHFRCWKSGTRGNLFKLVSIVEKCTYSKAMKLMGAGYVDLSELEKRVEELLGISTPDKPIAPSGITFPAFTHLISELPSGLKERRLAIEYLQNRKLSPTGLYFCLKEEYRNRIIIPYFDRNGILTYWNGRDITGRCNLRYRGPAKTENICKEHNVFMSFWPMEGSKVYCTEGEFDALTFNACGLYGAAFGGKEINEKQIKLLESYKIVLAFDNDSSGREAVIKTGTKLLKIGISNTNYILPAKGFKDWNEMLVKLNSEIVRNYVIAREKPLTELELTRIKNE